MASVNFGTLGMPKRPGGATGSSVISKVAVYGVEECLIKLAAVNKVARIELGYLSHKSAEIIQEKAKHNIHPVTGNLETGVTIAHPAPYVWTIEASSMAGGVPEKNSYEYASFVEFGTSTTGHGYPSYGFMRRAYAETLPDIMVALKNIGEHLERL